MIDDGWMIDRWMDDDEEEEQKEEESHYLVMPQLDTTVNILWLVRQKETTATPCCPNIKFVDCTICDLEDKFHYWILYSCLVLTSENDWL